MSWVTSVQCNGCKRLAPNPGRVPNGWVTLHNNPNPDGTANNGRWDFCDSCVREITKLYAVNNYKANLS